MKHCSELLQVYSNFAKIVETQFSKCIKIFRYDNALEYTQYAFQAVLHSYGTALHVGSPPDYHHLHSFGSAYFVFLQPHEHNKLELRSRLYCFLGYGETQKGYRCYDPVSHRLYVSRNVVFWEHRSFVELSHFHASLSSSSVLDLFPDEAHIPNPPVAAPDPLIVAPNPPVSAPDHPVVAPDSPVNVSVQPLYILDPFPSSPFN